MVLSILRLRLLGLVVVVPKLCCRMCFGRKGMPPGLAVPLAPAGFAGVDE